jgi:hypothetical protein
MYCSIYYQGKLFVQNTTLKVSYDSSERVIFYSFLHLFCKESLIESLPGMNIKYAESDR